MHRSACRSRLAYMLVLLSMHSHSVAQPNPCHDPAVKLAVGSIVTTFAVGIEACGELKPEAKPGYVAQFEAVRSANLACFEAFEATAQYIAMTSSAKVQFSKLTPTEVQRFCSDLPAELDRFPQMFQRLSR